MCAHIEATARRRFGFKIEMNDHKKFFFLADDHKAMWFWVTGIVKWVNHIARAFSRRSTNRLDLGGAVPGGANTIELSDAAVRQLICEDDRTAQAATARVNLRRSDDLPPNVQNCLF